MKTELEASASVMRKALDGQRSAFEKCIQEIAAQCGQLRRERDELLAALRTIAVEASHFMQVHTDRSVDAGRTMLMMRTVDAMALIARIEKP
jgi:hypothetical protein